MNKKNYMLIETRWIDGDIDYDGSQLRSHYAREIAGIRGDAVVAFAGRCDVRGKSLVDLEDFEEGSTIVAARMVHFIGEHFQCPLREANLRLRIFVTIISEVLASMAPSVVLARDGDDLFAGDKKLTVAIVTSSAISSVFHCGINIDPSGAPVPAEGLDHLGVDPVEFAGRVLARYTQECESVELALRKVRGV